MIGGLARITASRACFRQTRYDWVNEVALKREPKLENRIFVQDNQKLSSICEP
jgi:hypothetical protein